jgi:ligand-binding sensor protein
LNHSASLPECPTDSSGWNLFNRGDSGAKSSFGKKKNKKQVMNMYSIRSKQEWQKVLDSVHEELGMTSAITDKENKVLQVSGERKPLCSRIRSIEESLAFICSQAQQSMAQETNKKKRPVIDACDAGMAKFVLPVFYEGDFVGTLTACGARVLGTELETFIIEKATKINERDIDGLIQQVPQCDEKAIARVVQRLS